MKGRLIIIDGIDGSGITTQSELLYKFLKSNKRKVVLLKEPSDKKIINLIKKFNNPLIEFFLFLIDRKINFDKVTNYLKRGYIVICQRSFPSTFVYQFYLNLRNIFEENLVYYLNHLAMNHITPDLVLVLDVNIEEALKRLKTKKKKSKISKFEKKEILKKAREGYLYFAKRYNWKLINSNLSIKEVFEEIKKEVLSEI